MECVSILTSPNRFRKLIPQRKIEMLSTPVYKILAFLKSVWFLTISFKWISTSLHRSQNVCIIWSQSCPLYYNCFYFNCLLLTYKIKWMQITGNNWNFSKQQTQMSSTEWAIACMSSCARWCSTRFNFRTFAFLKYINDFPEGTSLTAKLSADDTSLFSVVKDVSMYQLKTPY